MDNFNRPQLSTLQNSGTSFSGYTELFSAVSHEDLLDKVQGFFTSPSQCNRYLVAYTEICIATGPATAVWWATIITSNNP